ncbi:unnamed protein product [Timema podura]|nr:unnamed protein product [Timema podura]
MLVPGEGRPPSRLAGIRPGGVGLVGGKVQAGGLATFSRSMSQDSGSSSGTGSSGDSSLGLSFLNREGAPAPLHADPALVSRRIPPENQREVAMW